MSNGPDDASRRKLIEELQARVHACLAPHVSELPFAIVDFPDIRNCGDSAIWLGEMAYLRDRHRRRPSYVSRINDFSTEELKRRVPDGPIFIHGGGNFGDIWASHQDFRERVLTLFPDRKVIQFPQSIHFDSAERLASTARVIGKHRHFTLLVRDEESLAVARANFDCEIELCPDMAFCIGPAERVAPVTIPVLAMLREDKEKAGERDLSNYPDVPVEDWITESYRRVRVAKALGALAAVASGRPDEIALRKLDAAARNRFKRGVRQLSGARAVITDRLHVHIISLLLGIPHAVLDNSYGKVRRFMSAFSGGTAYSYLPDSFDDGMAWARQRAIEL